jgi:type I restriction enzyme S subunit
MSNKWRQASLAELAEFRNGMNFTQGSRGEKVKVVGVGDFGARENLADYSNTETVMINGELDDEDLLKNDDLLFVRSNGNKALIGRCVLIENICEPISFSGFTIRARSTSAEVDPSFLSKVVRSPLFKAHLHRCGGGSSINNLNQMTLANFEFPLPTLPEQRQIAEILRTWDEAIEKLLRLIEIRGSQYLGLRDHLIDWSNNQRALKGVLKPISRPVPRPTSGYRALSIRSHGKGSFDRFVENPESVDMETLYVAKVGDIIVNITFAWEGAVALVPPEHDGCLVSHRFPTFVPMQERVDARYLRHALRMPRFTYLLGIVSPGGAGRNRVLNKGDFLDLLVPLPSLAEQRRIAATLDDAERAIAGEVKRQAALTRQKRGLMQKLLTGEWRVKGAAKAAAE